MLCCDGYSDGVPLYLISLYLPFWDTKYRVICQESNFLFKMNCSKALILRLS